MSRNIVAVVVVLVVEVEEVLYPWLVEELRSWRGN